MASLQFRSGSYRVLFRHNGKLHTFTIGEVSQDEAESKSRQVDYLLMRLKQRLVVLPAGMGIVEYLQFDGKPAPTEEPLPEKISLVQLRDKYLATHEASLEPSTIYGMKLHFNHLTGILGPAFPIAELQLADLQRYVDVRSRAKGLNKRKLSPATIKKEIVTLRTAWNWGVRMKLVAGRFPYDGLRYPKTMEKPPFQTMGEIERQIGAGGVTTAEISELWHSLYLLRPEIDELLKDVKKHARHPFVYPMFVFAAHTGARRSEIIRAQVSDVDFADHSVLIHEKKRVRGSNTTRRVPLTPLLAKALKEWLAVHPGGRYLFCHAATVARSKKRSATTGHRGQKHRPKSNAMRLAPVRPRGAVSAGPLTPDEAHDHFRRALSGTKWKNVKGFHALRHSFCSNLAMRGIDQRMIDELVGHMTPEQQKRYRHLAPHTKAEALKAVFG